MKGLRPLFVFGPFLPYLDTIFFDWTDVSVAKIDSVAKSKKTHSLAFR
jgi:hypothetical protein